MFVERPGKIQDQTVFILETAYETFIECANRGSLAIDVQNNVKNLFTAVIDCTYW